MMVGGMVGRMVGGTVGGMARGMVSLATRQTPLIHNNNLPWGYFLFRGQACG